MITISDFKRLIRPLQNKIFLLIGRALISAIDNSEGTQKLSISLLQNENLSGVEKLQDYGFENYPKPGAEGVALFLNGNRNQGIVVVVHDRRYRPSDLVEGEVIVYTDEDLTSQDDRIHFKRGKIHRHKNNQHLVDAIVKAIFTTPLFQVDCNQHVINAAISDIITTPLFRVTGGTVELAAQATLKKLVNEEFITLFNSHVHSGVESGPSNTGVPTVTAGAAQQTINTKAS